MKRILATALAVLLIATMAISGSVAYLTSTDNAENTFTVGEIKIVQHEKDSTGADFEQDQQLLPSSSFNGTTEPGKASTGIWIKSVNGEQAKLDNGEIDKFVTVENTGKNSAYVRTIFAFEDTASVDTNGMIIKNWNDGTGAPGTVTTAGQVLINGVVYNLYVYTYTDALESGETTEDSLRQVAMSSKAGNAEVEAIRAIGDGKYTILVATQAVQAENMGDMTAEQALNAAFGAISDENNPWKNGEVDGAEASGNVVRISTAEQFKALGGDGITKDTTIVLEKDIDLEGEEMIPILSYTNDGADLKFDGQNHTISNVKLVPNPTHRSGMDNVGLFEVSLGDAKLTVENLTLKNVTAEVTTNGINPSSGVAAVVGYVNEGCTAILNNVDVYNANIKNIADNASVFVGYTTGKVTMTDCNAYGCKIKGGNSDKTGTFVGTANTSSCTVSISNCANNATDLNTNAQAKHIGRNYDDTATVTINNVTEVALAISTKKDLFDFAKAVNESTLPAGSFQGKNVVLLADIDLNNEPWTPIGQSRHAFYGSFNGNGHTIRNLKVVNHADAELISSGLFGYSDIGGTIENLNIEGAYIEGHHNCGVIYGYISGSGVIKNCTVKNAEIKCTHVSGNETCGDKAGAIAGKLGENNTKVQNCKVENISITAGRDAGYVVGHAAEPGTVTGCTVSGDQTITFDNECNHGSANNFGGGKQVGNAT